ncbi:MAG TPA: fibronectin type III domain-containing protein [Patescibacteria group bacterium]|nr:fibronectin type III domain-containing protein [Patescibacteria group bacterium]
MTYIFQKNYLNLAKKIIFFSLILGLFIGILAPVNQLQALEPLTISSVVVAKNNNSATISWQVNRPAFGKLEYGLASGDYDWSLATNQRVTSQAITIFGLNSETTYYFRITAMDDSTEVRSFEQTFKTAKFGDNTAPIISQVHVPYTTGKTATIQWSTDEEATTEVEYGLTANYGSTKSDNRLVRVHDITLTGLVDGTYYHFRVRSKDKDNNISHWEDLTFRTKVTDISDRDSLIIYNITPAGENDLNIANSSAVITWRTNKLAEGLIKYGVNINFGKTVNYNPPRDFFQSITLTGLKADTTYYFQIEAKDVTGKIAKSETLSFKTRPNPAGVVSQPTTYGSVLGTGTCDVNLTTDFGFYGLYYNLTSNHPDVEQYKGSIIPNTKVGRENDWYNAEYFSLSRVDKTIIFGQRFLPINEGKPGDPYGFAVNWRAIIDVPTDGIYRYTVASDDDSWVLIDDQLTSDLGGLHPAKNTTKDINLTAGYHKIEIFYAERQKGGAQFDFKPDTNLKFHPLPEGCEIEDVLAFNRGATASIQTQTQTTGRVLGVSTLDIPTDPYRGYACNPDLGYTKIKALYKTTDSPDIWAILETGQKHYITSLESFNKYECNWSKIKTVSKKTLDGFASANLVRTPNQPTVYHLFQRPDRKWLKINMPSPTVFISYQNNFWGNIARINELDIAAYPDVRLIKKIGDKNIYLIEGSTKRLIPNETVFKNRQFEWFEVVEINSIHMESYADAAQID